MADAYDFAVINLVRSDLTRLYPPHGSWQRSMITASSIFGAMVGQLVLGFLADNLGRRRLLLVSGGLTIAGALGSACAFDFGDDHVGIWALLIFWRFVMGFGIGGEYPLSAAHTAEHSRAENSGRRLAWVFVLFGVGPLMASIVVYTCQVSGASGEFTWRCAFGFGAALSVLSLTLRYRLVKNSPRFERVRRERARRTQREAMLDSEGSSGGGASFGGVGAAAHLDDEAATATGVGGAACQGSLRAAFRETLSVASRYRRPLLGTMLCWLLYDIVDYGLGLYSDDVLQKLKVGTGNASTTLAVMLVQIISLPGCVAAVWLVPRLGRRGTQLFGLAGMLLTYATLAIILSLPSLKDAADKQPALMVSLYALQLTFDYMGPGATTYIIPAELFPTTARATCHGLSAASGKVGAAIGSYAFGGMIKSLEIRGCFVFTACMSAMLIGVTLLLIPAYDSTTLRHLEDADKQGMAMLLLYRPAEYFKQQAHLQQAHLQQAHLQQAGIGDAHGDAAAGASGAEDGSPRREGRDARGDGRGDGRSQASPPPSPPPSPPAPTPAPAPTPTLSPTAWRMLLHETSAAAGAMPPYRSIGSSVNDGEPASAATVVVTPDTDGFRRLARLQVDLRNDSIVEIGCSYGGCSALLLATGAPAAAAAMPSDELAPVMAAASSSEPTLARANYVGVDNSFECVSHCRKAMPSARFEKLDALSDAPGLAALLRAERPSLVVIDVGGNRALADVAELVERVVHELAGLAGPRAAKEEEVVAVAAAAVVTAEAEAAEAEVETAEATEAEAEAEAEADTGRPAAASSPATSSTQPLLILVKSETLAADLVEEMRLRVARSGATPSPGRCPEDGASTAAAIQCPDGWWAALRGRGLAQAAQDRAAGIDRHRLRPPTWYPQRVGPGGVKICRFHNYDATRGCKRGAACPLDHEHCHYCLQAGHAAHACEAFRGTFAESQ